MPTIINPYKGTGDSLGESLAGLGEAFFGPKASQSALYREKFREQQRQNLGVEDLATLLQDPNASSGAMAAAAARGGVAYNNLGGYNLFGVAGRNPNPLDPRVLQAQTQAQVPYGSTATGFTAAQATEVQKQQIASERAAAAQQAIADRTLVPTMTPAGPVYTRSVDAPGQRPVLGLPQEQGIQFQQNWASGFTGLTPQQQTGLHVAPKTEGVDNWGIPGPGGITPQGRTIDGRTDLTTGAPLPQNAQVIAKGSTTFAAGTAPGSGITRDVQAAIRSADQTLVLGNQILEKVTADPTIVGLMGNVRRIGQETADVVANATRAAKVDLQARGVTARAQALLPELFDENLNSIQTLNGLLVYRAAEAIGQTGRGASDKDIERVLSIVGRPDSWLQGPQTYQSKVRQLMAIIQGTRDADVNILKSKDVTVGGATPPTVSSGTPTGAAPIASGTTSTGVPWTVEP